jgi:serine/threonine protein kinase
MRKIRFIAISKVPNVSRAKTDDEAANVLLTGAGGVKMADFGVAAQLSHSRSKRNTFGALELNM